jgi:hypothetical protein
VYRAETAGFRAHRFCDCTTYAVPRGSFDIEASDWVAYQRWGSGSARSAVKGARTTKVVQSVPRLTLVNAQIASYEPIVQAGNGTEWMRDKLQVLYDERSELSSLTGSDVMREELRR